jgi:hypothetical protein
MALVIDANMKLLADRLNISSYRMIKDYGLSTVEEIIEAETEKGNVKAARYANEYAHSPEKLIELFELGNIENKFVILNKMDDFTRARVLPLLAQEDLAMGLNFFTQEKLLYMLMEVDIGELVRVARDAFSLEQIMMMLSEEDLAKFMMHDKLEKYDVMKHLKSMPPEIMIKFVEGVTGQPYEQSNPAELFASLDKLPDDKFKKFMACIDPDIQRHLTFELTKQKPEYLNLFSNGTYVDMLNTLMKPEMVKPMVMLNKETLVKMLTELPGELMAIVAAQVDTKDFAKFLQDGQMDILKEALLI